MSKSISTVAVQTSGESLSIFSPHVLARTLGLTSLLTQVVLASPAQSQDLNLRQCSNQDKIVAERSAGGDGGDVRWDESSLAKNGPITQIDVWSADLVDAVRFKYGSVYGDKHGGDGGEYQSMQLRPGEHITFIEGRAAAYVDRLCFGTNMTEQPRCFGGKGGDYFQMQAPGSVLVGMKGSSGKYTDKLTFQFGRQWRAQDGSFRYSSDALQNAILNRPAETDSQIYTNDTDLPQKFTYSKTVSQTDITRTEWRDEQNNTWKIGVELKIAKKFGPVKGSAKLNFEYTRSETKSNGGGSENQANTTKAWTYPVSVPPSSQVSASATWYNIPLNLDATYTAIYFDTNNLNKTKDICQEQQSTSFQGVASSNVVIDVSAVPLVKNQ